MKKRTLFLMIVAASVLLSSCAKEDLSNDNKNEPQIEIAVDEAIQAVMIEDIHQMVDIYSGVGEGMLKSAEIVETGCPVVTVERVKEDQDWPRKITLDFGDVCDKNGKKMSGKIIIVKTGPLNMPGSVREVSFRKHVVDNVTIAGSKRIKNITQKDGAPTFSFGVDLELTFREGDKVVQKIIRKAEKTQVWIEGFGKRDVPAKYTVSGRSKIVIVRGAREKVIDKKVHLLLIAAGCKFPQKGVAEMSVRNFDGAKMVFSLDYATIGTGENCQAGCDCFATISKDKTSEVIDLSKKR